MKTLKPLRSTLLDGASNTLLMLFLIFTLLFPAIGKAASSIDADWPDASGTSTSGSVMTVCMGVGHECDFRITLKVENSTGSTSDVWVYIKDSKGSYQKFEISSVPDDNLIHYYTFNLDGLIRERGGIYTLQALFTYNSSTANSAKTFVLANNKISLSINGNRDVDGIVESSNTGGGCNGLKMFAAQYTCSSSLNLTWVLSVNQANWGTYSAVALTSHSATLSSGDVSALNAGTFDLGTWYTNQGGSWADNALYNVYMVASGSGVWSDATIWLSHKVGPETYVRDYGDFVALDFSATSRNLAYAYNDWGFEQNRYQDVRVGKCGEHRISLYESPDLWNTYSSTTYTGDFTPYGLIDHRTPDYINPGSGNANYAYTQVCNRLCPSMTSDNLTVRMFWTRARLGEKWPQDWIFSSANNFVKTPAGPRQAAGCEITISGSTSTNPYNANSSPVSMSSVPAISSGIPGAKVTSGVAWFPPDPDWYDA